jgi:7-carboxy-7-deazaguanine synthase
MPVPAIPPTEAQLIEIFSSIQGEGVLVGCRQIFVRMAMCNLDCAYCDTPYAPVETCQVEEAPGSGNFFGMPNPVSLETLADTLVSWARAIPGVHHSISLTGGEPLVQGETLKEWLPFLSRILPIFLETNGTLPEALEPLLPHLDWISMDIKLPSLSGETLPREAHRDFLSLARSRHCQVKMVVGERTPLEEVEIAASLVQDVAPAVPLVLQPVTEGGRMTLSPRRLMEVATVAARIHPHLRVIPQTHRFVGLP